MKCWKRLGSLALTAALSLSLMMLPAHAASFSDIEGKWYESVIEDLYEKEITQGYPDGTFRPGGTMSAAEGLLFCTRMLGIDGKVQDAIYQDRKVEVDQRIPEGYSWAAKELAVAVELGILTLDELEDLAQIVPSTINSSSGPRPYLGWNIPREQFCMYVVRAMQLEPMAQSLSLELCTSYLSSYFSDVEEISPEYRPYIYVLRNYGIFNGESDSETGSSYARPLRNLKRSETAALISRAMDVMESKGLYAEAFEYTTYPWASGTIQDASSNPNGTVDLTLSDPITGSNTYTLPSDVVVYDEYNMPGSARSLINGQYVRLVMDEVDLQVYSARLCGQLSSLEGRIVTLGENSITLWADGQSQTLSYSRFTQFKAGDRTGDLTILDPESGYTMATCYVDGNGTLVGASLSGGTVQRTGIISAVATAANGITLTLTDDNGIGTDYVVAADVPVTVNGGEGALTAAHVGRPATLRVGEEDSKVASVSVDTQTFYIQGPIRGQDGTSDTLKKITIANRLDSDRDVTYTLAPSVVITYDGASRTAEQIENGWFATAQVIDGYITELTAYSATVQVEGVLSEIKYDTVISTLTVTQPDGGIQTYEIDMADQPTITREGKPATVALLRKGDSLTITLRYHDVESIAATAQEADLKGEITEISQTAAGTTVKIKLTDGTENIYTASSNVAVVKDGKALTRKDLSYGDQIAFIANGTELISVEILSTPASIDDSQRSGQILDLNTQGNTRSMHLLIPGIADPVMVDLKNVTEGSFRDTKGNSLSLRRGELKAGDTVTVYGSWNGTVYEATLVIKTASASN